MNKFKIGDEVKLIGEYGVITRVEKTKANYFLYDFKFKNSILGLNDAPESWFEPVMNCPEYFYEK